MTLFVLSFKFNAMNYCSKQQATYVYFQTKMTAGHQIQYFLYAEKLRSTNAEMRMRMSNFFSINIRIEFKWCRFLARNIILWDSYWRCVTVKIFGHFLKIREVVAANHEPHLVSTGFGSRGTPGYWHTRRCPYKYLLQIRNPINFWKMRSNFFLQSVTGMGEACNVNHVSVFGYKLVSCLGHLRCRITNEK